MLLAYPIAEARASSLSVAGRIYGTAERDSELLSAPAALTDRADRSRTPPVDTSVDHLANRTLFAWVLLRPSPTWPATRISVDRGIGVGVGRTRRRRSSEIRLLLADNQGSTAWSLVALLKAESDLTVVAGWNRREEVLETGGRPPDCGRSTRNGTCCGRR